MRRVGEVGRNLDRGERRGEKGGDCMYMRKRERER